MFIRSSNERRMAEPIMRTYVAASISALPFGVAERLLHIGIAMQQFDHVA